MRIISKFRDYYDSLQSLGQDQGLKYLRTERKMPSPIGFEMPSPIGFEPIGHGWYVVDKTHYTSGQTYVIGFCGSIYPVIIYKPDLGKTVACYSVDDLDRYVEGHCDIKDVKEYQTPRHRWSKTFRGRAKEFFAYYENNSAKYCRLFDDLKTPIFVAEAARGSNITCDAQLQPYCFYRVKDAYTAFQELQSYLNNLAQPEKPIPAISNSDMIEAKGFDIKTSFRREKQSK